jgi:hypothetical protein
MHLDDETYGSYFLNIANITDGDIIATEVMLSRDGYLQSDQKMVSIFVAFNETAHRQPQYPGDIHISMTHSELQNA